MKILVLGHKGMLGSDLMLRLAAAHDVTGIDIGDFDITAGDDCARVIAECSPEVVIGSRKFSEETGKTMRFWQIALQDYLGQSGCSK